MDVLPKLALLDEAGLLQSDVPVFVSSTLSETRFFRSASDIGRLKSVPFTPLVHPIRTHALTVAHGPSMDGRLAMSLRALLAVADSADETVDGRKVFITRSQARGRVPHNIDEIEALFRRDGYQIVDLDGFSFGEQVALFRSASHVAAIHGASLANLVWCEPRSVRVTEIVPRIDGDEFDCFLQLCEDLGFPYQRVLGLAGPFEHKRAPFSVSLDEVADALRR